MLKLSQISEDWKCDEKNLPPEPYKEVTFQPIIDDDGTVTTVRVETPCDHPCKGLNANHFRLGTLLETAPELINRKQFSSPDALAAADGLNELNNKLDEVL